MTLQVTASTTSLGGPGLCLATALRRLGNEVRLVTSVGDCEASERAVAFLAHEGVDARAVRHTGPLDSGHVLLDPLGSSIVFTRRHQPAPDLRAIADSVLQDVETVVVCSPTPLAGLLPIVGMLRRDQLVLNLHAGQCRELLAMPRDDLKRLLDATRMITVNEHEHDLVRALPELTRVPEVVVTRGAQGSTLRTSAGETSHPAHPGALERPANTNGAGEAFLAALLSLRRCGIRWEEAIRGASFHAWVHIRDPDSLAFPVVDPDALLAAAARASHVPGGTRPADTRLQAVVFDVDGVLVGLCHWELWRDALLDLLGDAWRDLQVPVARFTPASYRALVSGRPRYEGALAVLEHLGVADAPQRARQLGDQKQRRTLAHIDREGFSTFPDALRLLAAAKTAGLRVGAASSSKNASLLLSRAVMGPAADHVPGAGQHTRIADLLDVDVSGRDHPRGKPDPGIFLAAVAELGCSPSACLVVEDAVAGVAAARAGGLPVVGVARQNDHHELAGADLVVSTLDEVDADALSRGRLRRRARSPRPTPSGSDV